MDIENWVLIAGWEEDIRGLNGNGKNIIKIIYLKNSFETAILVYEYLKRMKSLRVFSHSFIPSSFLLKE